MEIDARKISDKYYEVTVSDGNAVINSGVLDIHECSKLAYQLDECSEYICPDSDKVEIEAIQAENERLIKTIIKVHKALYDADLHKALSITDSEVKNIAEIDLD